MRERGGDYNHPIKQENQKRSKKKREESRWIAMNECTHEKKEDAKKKKKRREKRRRRKKKMRSEGEVLVFHFLL